MAIEPEPQGRNIGGFMKKFQRQWDQQRMIDAQEEMRRQRELREENAKQRDSRGQDKPKLADPASQSGINKPSSLIGLPLERRDGAGVGGSTGRVTQYDSSKAPPYLDAIADKYGINRDDFKRMAFIESGFDPNNRNSSSGASGLFQFLPGTAKEYNLQNPFDGPANAEAAAQLWNNNKAYLTKALGRDPTAGELYLAHQQGAGGAAKLLANPNASAGSLLGERAVSLNGGQPGMRAGDFAGMWTRKFDAGGSATSGGQTPKSVLDSTVTPSSNAIQFSTTLAGVDGRLINIMNTAAQGLPAGYTVRATSGERNQSYGFHPKGLAADFQIIGPKGPISNRGEDSTGLYTQLAKNAYAAQQQLYPELSGKLAWGGAFATVPGGNVADLMHFDLGGERGNLHPEFRPSRLAGGDTPARTQIAADTTTRNDASPSRQQDMGGASAPTTTGTPMATTPSTTPASSQVLPTDPRTPAPAGYYWDLGKQGEKPKLISRATGKDMAGQPVPGVAATPAATTPNSTTPPASGNPMVDQPGGGPPRRPGELSQEFPNNRGQQPGEPPRRPFGAEQGPSMPTQPAQQPAAAGAARPAQQSADDPIGGFFKDIGSVFSGEPIKDQYGRVWDGFEGWVSPSSGAAAASNAPRLEDGRIDMTGQYNTQLTPDEEIKFQDWAKKIGKDPAKESADYDLRGAWKAGAGQAGNGHFPDTYKKPNHPTFSDQSQYSGKDGYVGGKWAGDDKSSTFTPSESNLKNMSLGDLQKYFQDREPNSRLMLQESSNSTQGQATADTSKSIFSDIPDIGSAFSPALNFFSSLFG